MQSVYILLIDPSKKFVSGKILLFFDEIQEYPEIATSLKFFNIDGRFDVICSGELLGINYKKLKATALDIRRISICIHSISKNFFWKKDMHKDVIDDILVHMKELKSFSELEQSVFFSHFLDYCILGGMPAVNGNYLFMFF